MKSRVLVIEDTEDNRRILRRLLESEGYECLEAIDGAAGLAAAIKERPDLIILDIQLPIIDGYEVARQLKANRELSSTPIIAVTSYALAGDEEKTSDAGCDGYLAKPFDPYELLALIQQFLPASPQNA